MMGEAVDPEGKLADEELRRMAQGEKGGSASVIIELALPPQRVEFEKRGPPGSVRAVPRRIAPYSPAEENEIASKTAEAEDLLRRSLAKPPVPLRAARAFAAEVTGDELRAIVGSPLVKTVRKSRVLK